MADTKISELTPGTPQDADEVGAQRAGTQNFRFSMLAIRTWLAGFFASSTDLTNHTGDATIHFTEASIDHDNITNNGANTHAQIDTQLGTAATHIADTDIHADHSAISVTAGDGLSGGGTIAANRTIDVDATVQRQISGGTDGNLVSRNVSGDVQDAGVSSASFAPAAHVGAGGAAHANFTQAGVAGFAPGSAGGTTEFLRADGSWAVPPGGGGGGILKGTPFVLGQVLQVSDAGGDGEATTTAGKVAADLVTGPASAVNARFASFNGTTGKIIQDSGSSAADFAAASHVGAGGAAHAAFTDVANGFTPASGGGTTNFLRADGNWAAPAGGGDVVGPASSVNNRIATFDGTTGKLIQDSGSTIADLGDVDGPGSAVNGNFASFDGTTGKLIQDSGSNAASFAAASHVGAGGAAHANFDNATAGFVPGSGGGTTNFLRADGTWAAPPGAGGGEVNDGENVGGFAGVYKDKSGLNIRLRSVQSSDGFATVTQNTDDIDITGPTNVIYLAAGGDVTAAVEAAPANSVIQLGLGSYDATDFKVDAQTDKIVRGMGPGTVINCTPSAVGTPPNRHPGSLTFSANTRCGLENMRIVLTDDGTQNGLSFGAIERASNTVCTDCWFKDLWIEVGEMDVGRTANSAILWAIGYIPADGSGQAYGLMLRNINIVSSCSGIRDTDGEMHLHDVNVWFGNTARTDTPNLIGFDDHRGGRSYYWSGKCTTGYATQNPNTDAAVYAFRSNQANSGGRLFLFNVVAFARNDGAGASRAIFVQRDGANSPWVRVDGGYYQAETTGGSQVEAIETNWTPANGNEGKVELISGRIGGVNGNTIGALGRTNWNASFTVSSNSFGTYFLDTSGAPLTATMHSNEGSVGAGSYHFKNIGGGANNATIAVGSGDSLDGVTDGTLTLKNNESATLMAGGVSGGNILWRVVFKTKRVVFNDPRTWTIGGAYTAGTDVAKFRIKLAPGQTARLIGVDRINSSGTGTVTINKNDVAIAAFSSLSVNNTWQSTAGDEALADGDDLDLVINASTSGQVLSVQPVIEYEVAH